MVPTGSGRRQRQRNLVIVLLICQGHVVEGPRFPTGSTAAVRRTTPDDRPAVRRLSIARGAAGLLPWFQTLRGL